MQGSIEFAGPLFSEGRPRAEIRKVVKEQLVGASLFYIGEVKPKTPVGVYGVLKGSWQYVYDDASQTSIIGTGTVEYAPAVELGRKAAPVPIKPLRLWVKRVLGISKESEINSVAFLIGRKKKRQATPGQFFATETWKRTLPTLNNAFMSPIGAKIVERLKQ